jgi:hypothetical protein
MAEAYQGMQQFEEAAMLIKDNLEMHSNNIQTLILQMRDSFHGGRFAEIREAGMKAEDLMARNAKSIEGDFIGQNFRNQIIDVMNATYQIKNIPMNVEYTDKRKRLMLDFLLPEPQQILSNIATEREGVDIKKTRAFYKTDKPGNPNSINNIFRTQSAIQKERIKMMNDPEHIAMLLEAKKKRTKLQKEEDQLRNNNLIHKQNHLIGWHPNLIPFEVRHKFQ